MIKQKTYKRFFAFGCSFTSYHWVTWADIVARQLNIPSYNAGSEGSDPAYTCNAILQCDKIYNFTDDDLLIVQWTNIHRQGMFDTKTLSWWTKVEKYFPKKDDLTWGFHNLAQMQLARKAYPFIQISMGNNWDYLHKWIDIFCKTKQHKNRLTSYIKLYKDCLICPNFYDSIMDSEWDYTQQKYGITDGHPLPSDHLKFVEEQLNLPIDAHIKKRVWQNQNYIIKNFDHNIRFMRNNSKYDPYPQESNLWFKDFYQHSNMKIDPNIGVFL